MPQRPCNVPAQFFDHRADPKHRACDQFPDLIHLRPLMIFSTVMLRDGAPLRSGTMTTQPVQQPTAAEREQYARASLPLKAVRIALLDANYDEVAARDAGGRQVGAAVASGFLVNEDSGTYLYTCWHVVTGINMHEPVLPGATGLQRRAAVRISLRANNPLGGGVTVVGGEDSIDVDLYDRSTTPWRPLWEQDDRSRDSDQIAISGLQVPFWHDAVRIRLPDTFRPSRGLQTLNLAQQLWVHMLTPGDDLFLVGYPYGYRPLRHHPTPVVLRRTVAVALMDGGSRLREVLLDGAGAKGMSGGPVFLQRDGEMHLVGMYTGAVFPDAPTASPDRTTALGSVCRLDLLAEQGFTPNRWGPADAALPSG